MKSRYEGKTIVKIQKTWREYMILIIVNVIEKSFNFIGKIIFKIIKRIV